MKLSSSFTTRLLDYQEKKPGTPEQQVEWTFRRQQESPLSNRTRTPEHPTPSLFAITTQLSRLAACYNTTTCIQANIYIFPTS